MAWKNVFLPSVGDTLFVFRRGSVSFDKKGAQVVGSPLLLTQSGESSESEEEEESEGEEEEEEGGKTE